MNGLVKPVDEAAPSSELELFNGVRERRITGRQAYAEWLDGNLTSDQLTEEGNAFAASYVALGVGPYLNDYADVLARDLPTEYHVADTWENYDLLARRIDERFAAWRAAQTR